MRETAPAMASSEWHANQRSRGRLCVRVRRAVVVRLDVVRFGSDQIEPVCTNSRGLACFLALCGAVCPAIGERNELPPADPGEAARAEGGAYGPKDSGNRFGKHFAERGLRHGSTGSGG